LGLFANQPFHPLVAEASGQNNFRQPEFDRQSASDK
jgi:hypothetical protein